VVKNLPGLHPNKNFTNQKDLSIRQRDALIVVPRKKQKCEVAMVAISVAHANPLK
jgi:hypothetical protein